MINGDLFGTIGHLPALLHELAVGQMVDATITRYMELSDVPAVQYSRSELLALFAEDAVWVGAGSSDQAKLGRQTGPEAIVKMLESCLPPKRHLVSNTHLLTQRHLVVQDTAAEGRWVMQRFSMYEDGTADLAITRLKVGFVVRETGALISRYQPEKLFVHSLDPQGSAASVANHDHHSRDPRDTG